MQWKDSTNRKRLVEDMTDQVAEKLPDHGSGLATIFVQHTTAAVTTADLDPGTDEDLLDFLGSLVPERSWRHPHNPEHAPDHLLASVIGPSVAVPFHKGRLQLGTWQRIILIEFDGPRDRIVVTQIAKED